MQTSASLLQSALFEISQRVDLTESSKPSSHRYVPDILSTAARLGSDFEDILIKRDYEMRGKSILLPQDVHGMAYDLVFGSLIHTNQVRVMAYFRKAGWGVIVMEMMRDDFEISHPVNEHGLAVQKNVRNITLMASDAELMSDLEDVIDMFKSLRPSIIDNSSNS